MLAPPGPGLCVQWRELPADALVATPAARIAALAMTRASSLLRFRKACIAAPFRFRVINMRAGTAGRTKLPGRQTRRDPAHLLQATSHMALSAARSVQLRRYSHGGAAVNAGSRDRK